MREPLNYAVMKYMLTVDEACPADVMEALKGEYSNHKLFKPAGIQEMLMVELANGLVEESRFDLDENNNLRVYYKISDYGNETVRSYLNIK